MNDWFRIPLTIDQVPELGNIMFEFSRRWLYSERKGIALLITQRPNEPADPRNTALFVAPLAVPLCGDLIRRYGGFACAEPPPSEAEWFAGDDNFMSSVRLASKAAGA